MKEKFEEPILEIIEFSAQDVEVVTSQIGGTGIFSQPDEKSDI